MEQLELISIYSAESEDSPLRADGQESKPSHSAKSKNTPSESSEKTSQEFGYSKTFGNFQQLNFASLSCLPEATRASLSAKPGSAEARKMTATSGLRCLELSEHQGRLGYSLKMLLDTLRWASTKCLLTWKAKTTPCNRLLFQLAPWTPRTDEIESGLLPTPTNRSVMNMWQTAEYLIKTNGVRRSGVKVGSSIAWTIAKWHLLNGGQKIKANPDPCFYEMMMGYPKDWTALQHSETQSFRPSHTKSSKQ